MNGKLGTIEISEWYPVRNSDGTTSEVWRLDVSLKIEGESTIFYCCPTVFQEDFERHKNQAHLVSHELNFAVTSLLSEALTRPWLMRLRQRMSEVNKNAPSV